MIDRMRLRIGTVATLGVAVLAAGCSGGGSTSLRAIPAATKAAPPGKSSKVQLNLRIPIRKTGTKSSRRSPKYVSVWTNDIAIRVLGPGATIDNAPWQLFDVSTQPSASPNAVCTVSGLFRNCSITVTAPAVDGATETIFQGNILSTGYTTSTVVAGAVNTVNVGLTGVIGLLTTDKPAYSIWAAPGASANVVTGTTIVNITANDFDGGQIAGQQPTFANPIVFTDIEAPPSPFTYPSANVPTSYGLPVPTAPGPIPATMTYTAPIPVPPATLAPASTTVTVQTDTSFLPAMPLKAYPTTTFVLNTMVVSVAGAPVASVPGLAVSGSDVTVTVAEVGATSFTVTPNNATNSDGGSFTMFSGSPSVPLPLTGPSTINALSGTGTFIVHASTPTQVAGDAPTISIVDANGTTATLTAVVGP
jgi:hypothetical protein